MAHAHPYDTSAQALYWPARGPAFFDDWLPGDTGNEDLLCAEMSRLAYADRANTASALSRVDFDLVHWMGGEAADQRGATRGTDGFIARGRTSGVTVLAFRGTESNKPEDIFTDALATSVPWRPSAAGGGHVHRGFAQAYASVRRDLSEVLASVDGPLLITGHSLGAGVATLAAADLGPRARTLVTFGSPRVGDEEFGGHLRDVTMRRFVDCCDLVTRIPPRRFDEPNIEQLLADLIPPHQRSAKMAAILVKAIATTLAGTLGVLGIQPSYEHVCEATYRDRHGQRLPSVTAESVEADQRDAREAHRGSLTPDIGHLMQELVSRVCAAGVVTDVTALRGAIRDFGARLFQGDPVPLRDLADHAPINYVSLFTGRT